MIPTELNPYLISKLTVSSEIEGGLEDREIQTNQ